MQILNSETLQPKGREAIPYTIFLHSPSFSFLIPINYFCYFLGGVFLFCFNLKTPSKNTLLKCLAKIRVLLSMSFLSERQTTRKGKKKKKKHNTLSVLSTVIPTRRNILEELSIIWIEVTIRPSKISSQANKHEKTKKCKWKQKLSTRYCLFLKKILFAQPE